MFTMLFTAAALLLAVFAVDPGFVEQSTALPVTGVNGGTSGQTANQTASPLVAQTHPGADGARSAGAGGPAPWARFVEGPAAAFSVFALSSLRNPGTDTRRDTASDDDPGVPT
ncbi:MAG: hypothetical protein ACFB6R_09555 [Alphaproteobacteria bacterium]